MKKGLLKILFTIMLLFPGMINALETSPCVQATSDSLVQGNKVTVCINTNATGVSGDDSHHRYVKNMHSRNYTSVLVVQTLVFLENYQVAMAYCVNENLHGVGDQGLGNPASYKVTLKDWNTFASTVGADKANKVRNVILNGYPAKSAAELGFKANSDNENRYDAFTATKLAVFTVLNHYGYSLSNDGLTYYVPATVNDDGTRGTLIVNKIKDLVKYSNETPKIDQPIAFSESEITADDNNVTKVFNVNPPMGGTLTVSLTNPVSGVKIDGVEATSKQYTNSGYYGSPIKITVTVPKNNIPTEGMNMGVTLKYDHKNFDLFYGDSGDSKWQNYIVVKPKTVSDSKTFSFKYDKTCDDVIADYQDCSACEKAKEEYDKCSKDNTCSDEVKQKYQACNGNFTCSDKLKEEYKACVPDRTCEDVKKDYNSCTTCEQVKKEYDKCSKDNSCSDEIKKQYESCNGNFTCSDKLKEEYNECFPPRTCEDVKKDYNSCTTCEQVKKEYDKCSKDNSCSDEIKKQYASCNGNFTCSNELINEYDECFPTIEEENPNTMGLNIILITLASVGSVGVGYTAYVKRKKLKQF